MTDHVAVVDLDYCDAGKGTVVEAICASTTVRAALRFNRGAKAAHNVVTKDSWHHTFAQFGSGTLRGCRPTVTRFMVVDPLALAAEAAALGDLYSLQPSTGTRCSPLAGIARRAGARSGGSGTVRAAWASAR